METAAEVVSMWRASGQEMTPAAALSEALRISDRQIMEAGPLTEVTLRKVTEGALKTVSHMVHRLPPEAGGDDMDRLSIATVWGCIQGLSMAAARMVNSKQDQEAETMLNRMAALGMALRLLQDKVNEREEQS